MLFDVWVVSGLYQATWLCRVSAATPQQAIQIAMQTPAYTGGTLQASPFVH